MERIINDVENRMNKRLQIAKQRENDRSRQLILVKEELKSTAQALENERKSVRDLIHKHYEQVKDIQDRCNAKVSTIEANLRKKLANEKRNWHEQKKALELKFNFLRKNWTKLLYEQTLQTFGQLQNQDVNAITNLNESCHVDNASATRESRPLPVNLRKRRIVIRNDVPVKKSKPVLPEKNLKLITERVADNGGNSSYVKNVIRKLQEKEPGQRERRNFCAQKSSQRCAKEMPNQAVEDLKAIDADLERLRNQINERDNIINSQNALIEKLKGDNAEKKHNFMSEDLDVTTEYQKLKKQYIELESNFRRLQTDLDEKRNTSCLCDNKKDINPMLVQEIKSLRKKERDLLTENADLKNKVDIMEFRILELEESYNEEKEGNQHSMRESLHWPDAELEDKSDSGVTSLPTSDDLNDSDLGDMLTNSTSSEAKLTGVATVFPSGISGSSYFDEKLSLCQSSSKRDSIDILNESGIFEKDAATTLNQSSQTEFDACTSPDIPNLSTEISKLSEIQKRIQRSDSAELRNKSPTLSYCGDSVAILEEKIEQLEGKLHVYETSGSERDHLLRKRLERENLIAFENRMLRERVCFLEDKNKQLEEERCEFEEAENDARLHCQKLELKIQGVIDVKRELENQLKEKIDMEGDTRKACSKLEEMIETYKVQNEKLEVIASEAQKRLQEFQDRIPEILTQKMKKWSYLDETNEDFEVNKSESRETYLTKRLQQLVENDVALRKKIAEHEATEKAFMKTLQQADEIWASMEDEFRKKLKQAEDKVATLTSENDKLRKVVEDRSWEKAQEEMYDLRQSNAALLTQVEVIAEDSSTKLEIIKVLEKENNRMRQDLAEYTELRTKYDELMKQRLRDEELCRQQIFTTIQEAESKFDELNMHGVNNELKQKIMEHDFAHKQLAAVLQEKEERLTYLENDFKNKICELTEELNVKTKVLNEQNSSIIQLNDELEKKTKALQDLEVTASELREEIDTLEPPPWDCLSMACQFDDLMKISREVSPNGEPECQSSNLQRAVNFSEEKSVKEYTPSSEECYSPELVPSFSFPKYFHFIPFLPQGQLESLEGENRLLTRKSMQSIVEEQKENMNQVKEHVVSPPNNVISPRPKERIKCDLKTFSLQTLQLALDNLRIKSRCQCIIINEVILQHLKQSHYHMLRKKSGEKVDELRLIPYKKSECKNHCDCMSSNKESIDAGRCLRRKASDLYDMFAITKIKRIGLNSLLVQWDSSQQLSKVIGYEVYVNGELHHKIDSPCRQKVTNAILRTVDFDDKPIVVSVYAISHTGKTSSCGVCIFPRVTSPFALN